MSTPLSDGVRAVWGWGTLTMFVPPFRRCSSRNCGVTSADEVRPKLLKPSLVCYCCLSIVVLKVSIMQAVLNYLCINVGCFALSLPADLPGPTHLCQDVC